MIETTMVLFFLALTPPGQKPIKYDKEEASLEECLDDVKAVLSKLSPTILDGGSVQAGCVVIKPPSPQVRK